MLTTVVAMSVPVFQRAPDFGREDCRIYAPADKYKSVHRVSLDRSSVIAQSPQASTLALSSEDEECGQRHQRI